MLSRRIMDLSPLLFLFAVLAVGCECAALQCAENDFDNVTLLEGEAFSFTVRDIEEDLGDDQITWNKSGLWPEQLSTNESQRVHYHGKTLVILKVQPTDTGVYTAKKLIGWCSNHYVGIEIKSKMDDMLLYGKISNSDINAKVNCPGNVNSICRNHQGNLSWEKDSKPLNGSRERILWIMNATDKDEGVYTCVCTWKHNGVQYRSTGSRRIGRDKPIIDHNPRLLFPDSSEVLADKGLPMKLNCTVFCGFNVGDRCKARWKLAVWTTLLDGYNQDVQTVTTGSNRFTTSTAVLTISRVLERDFRNTLTCVGEGALGTVSKEITLRQRGFSFIPIVALVGLLLSSLFVAVLLKCFAIDIVLFLRPCLRLIKYKRDTRMYDAYVIYQMECLDKAADDVLSQFITKTLPSVLEDKCGYHLFIHGRDDMPGQGHLELVESCIQQSKRLMVILTPASGLELQAGAQYSDMRGCDWQIVLHHVLVQGETGVILVQIGETGPGGFADLPSGLQHLILKRPPLKWRPGSWGAASRYSRFWRKVRYLMPAVPAAKC